MLLRQFDQAPVTAEPVSVAEAQAAGRIDGTEFDLLLPANITAARELAEQQAGRYFAARTVRAELSDWPCDPLAIVPAGAVTVAYWAAGAWQTLDPAQYVATPLSNGLALEPAAGAAWPTLDTQPGARVRIDVQVPGACPRAAFTYIVAQAVYWTLNPAAAGERKHEPSPFLHHLLDAVRVYA